MVHAYSLYLSFTLFIALTSSLAAGRLVRPLRSAASECAVRPNVVRPRPRVSAVQDMLARVCAWDPASSVCSGTNLDLLAPINLIGRSFASRSFSFRRDVVEFSFAHLFDDLVCVQECEIVDDPVIASLPSSVWDSSRGAGFWTWKPVVVRQVLDRMAANDVLVYFDAGCRLNDNPAALLRLLEYFLMVVQSDIGFLRFELMHREAEFTNSHASIVVGVDDAVYRSTNQLVGGAFVLRRTPFSVEFFQRMNFFLRHHPLIFSDALTGPSDRDHRHDQSVMSLLYRQMGGNLILPDETFFPNGFVPENARFPIWMMRASEGWTVRAGSIE